MHSHICFNCKEAMIRKVDEFLETACQYFPPVMQQVRGDVSRCEAYTDKNGDEAEQKKRRVVE